MTCVDEDGFKIGGTFIKYDWVAYFLIVFFFLLRLQLAFNYNFWPDEGREGLDALFLQKNPLDIMNIPHAIHPPLFMYVEALFFAVLGVSDLTIKLVVPVFALLLTWVIYLLGSRLISKPAGIIALALYSTSYIPFFMSTRALTETPTAFFYALTLLLFYIGFEEPEKKYRLWKWDVPYLYLAGASLGLGLLTKETAYFLIPTIFVYALFSRRNFGWLKKREFWVAVAIAIVIFAPWAYRNAVKLGDPTGALWYTSAGTNSAEYKPDYFYYLSALPSVLGDPTSLLVLLGIVLLLRDRKEKKALFILSWILVMGVMMSFANLKDPRYILPLFPALFLAIAYIPEGFRNTVKQSQSTLILVLAVGVIVVTSYGGVAQAILQKGQGYYGLKETGDYILKNISSDQKVMAGSFVTTGFYARRELLQVPGTQEEFLRLVPTLSYVQIDNSEPTPSYLLPYLSSNMPNFTIEKIFTIETDYSLDKCPFYIINNKCLYGSLLLKVVK